MSQPFFNETCLIMAKALAKHQSDWFTRTASQHLPPIICRWALERRHMDFVIKWIARNGYSQRIHIGSGKVEFCKGDKILATYVPPEFKFPNKVTYPFFQ